MYLHFQHRNLRWRKTSRQARHFASLAFSTPQFEVAQEERSDVLVFSTPQFEVAQDMPESRAQHTSPSWSQSATYLHRFGIIVFSGTMQANLSFGQVARPVVVFEGFHAVLHETQLDEHRVRCRTLLLLVVRWCCWCFLLFVVICLFVVWCWLLLCVVVCCLLVSFGVVCCMSSCLCCLLLSVVVHCCLSLFVVVCCIHFVISRVDSCLD